MDSFLNRYRSITVLLLVIFAQLVLIAFQAKNDQDVRFIRVWTVTAVSPVARVLEAVRGGGSGFFHNYLVMRDASAENRQLRAENDRLKMDNIFLKNELNTADRAQALKLFTARTPSKYLAATVIMRATDPGTVWVDRGSAQGVERGMGVVTPDGIVGKVTAAYAPAATVMLITDSDFGAGVMSQKGNWHGTLRGQGTDRCRVDYVRFEDKVEVGDWLYTSGDDRIFPRGFRVGVVKSVRNGQPFKEVEVEPSGLGRGIQDVLILLEGVHQDIPQAPVTDQPVYIGSAPPAAAGSNGDAAAAPVGTGTEADKLREQYRSIGEAQGHVYGDVNSKIPEFNGKPPAAAGSTPKPADAGAAAPGAAGPNGAHPPVAGGRGSPQSPPDPKAADKARLANQAAGAGGGR